MNTRSMTFDSRPIGAEDVVSIVIDRLSTHTVAEIAAAFAIHGAPFQRQHALKTARFNLFNAADDPQFPPPVRAKLSKVAGMLKRLHGNGDASTRSGEQFLTNAQRERYGVGASA